MDKRRIIFIIFCFLIMMVGIRASAQQSKTFSSDQEKFIKDLASFFGKSTHKKEGKEIMDKFSVIWVEGRLTEEQKKSAIGIANKLLENRAMAFPHFESYVKVISAFEKSNKDDVYFENWKTILYAFFKEKKLNMRDVNQYLDQTAALMDRNSIFVSPLVDWVASSDDYRLVMDNGVKIIFDTPVDIICYSKRDSLKIFKTKGTIEFLEADWTGFGGIVYWERAGFERDELYAELKRYRIDMKKSYYVADSVEFINKYYFQNALQGTLNDKVVADANEKTATYPRFNSYTKRFQIKAIYENIDFDGGFSMQGAKFIGTGDETKLAQLNFFRKDTLFLTASSHSFTFRKDQIVGQNTSILFHLYQDSIYHPGLNFRYLVETKEILLLRNDEGMSRCPYFNSYHEVDMDFDILSWKMEEPKILFHSIIGSTNKVAFFESSAYFSKDRYQKLQGMDEQNPLLLIKNFVNEIGTDEFSAESFTRYTRKDISGIRHVLMGLSYMGFISFNTETDQVKVMQRLDDYIHAYSKKKDYDVISLVSNMSESTQENASLNLLNYDLSINGVPEIHLSDSQNVVIYPENEKILFKKNRDFEFDGQVVAGLFTFVGKNFSFEYDKFKINLNNVDALKLKVQLDEKDEYGNRKLKNVQTIIEQVTGDLLIDFPSNKSALKDYPQYPIFNSREDSYVYFDKILRTSKNEKVYPRDKFYFQIYPYTIDSLDNFTKEGLHFNGYFVSGGIFPPFEESLILMPDYSLGFNRKTPPGGYPLYGGKGIFKNDIILSNSGLQGSGDFEYITSLTRSEAFIFYPDSMNAQALEFVVTPQASGVQFPTVLGTDVYIHWMPYQDELFAKKQEIPFEMYDDQAKLHGTLKVKPTGLTGWGKMDFVNAELYSDEFKFLEQTFDADTSKFNLKSFDMDDFSFKTENVNSHIDWTQRKGTFKSNGEASFVEFPHNQYICFMNQFNWYMDDEEIEMSADSEKKLDPNVNLELLSPTEREDIQLEGSKFISIHPKQDSLWFVAPKAKYSLRRSLITANEVKYIRVADATVNIVDGEVIVEKKAKMRTLPNTTILANNTSQHHFIYNATTNIYGAKSYAASGDYNYTDEINKKQKIHFDLVAVDTNKETFAKGKIGMTDGFSLSPNYEFTGDVRMIASIKFLNFDGSTRISHECDTLNRYWVNFQSEIDPLQIFIPFVADSSSEINKATMAAGFYMTKDSSHIYSAFLTKKREYSDIQMLPIEGFINYDKATNKYKISNREKLIEPNLPGNYLTMHSSICNLYGEGTFYLGPNFGQVKYQTVGNGSCVAGKDNFSFDLLMALDFKFNDKCLDLIVKTIETADGLEGVDMTRKTFTKGLAELIGTAAADRMVTDLALGTYKKVQKELQHTIFINQLKLDWNTQTHSYISNGKIGISNIGKDKINKLVEGKMELIKKRSGDQFHLYLKINDAWFYFFYRGGQMLAVSSVAEFNTIIKEMKADDRKMETEKGQIPYSYNLGAPSMMTKFLKNSETTTGEEEDE